MPEKHAEAAARIQQAHAAKAERIRNRSELTNAAKIGMLAKAHSNAKAAMAELQKSVASDTLAERTRLQRQAFGSEGLKGDPSTLIVSVSDAQDRAERLNSPQEAAALLERAEVNQDEPLARAVAAHSFAKFIGAMPSAHDRHEWADVVDGYTANRPAVGSSVVELSLRAYCWAPVHVRGAQPAGADRHSVFAA